MLDAGATVDRYRIDAPIGRGGMGQVYKAFDLRLRRAVALKILHEALTAEGMARLVREARLAASLAHPNIVAVLDVGEHEGVAYMAMELVVGKPLSTYVRREPAPTQAKLRWLVDVARGLDAAHRAGLVHRDVKPANVMITAPDARAKILDFGIAKQLDDDARKWTALLPALRTQPGFSMGTPMYMAPEVLRGEHPSDATTDQFAWGVLAFELLTGARPRRDDVESGGTWTPPRLYVPDLPPRLASIVETTLGERAVRFSSMGELANALEAGLAAPPSSASSVASVASVSSVSSVADDDDDDDASDIPDGRGAATATRMFPVKTPKAVKQMPGAPPGAHAAEPPRVREPSRAILAPFVSACIDELARAVPGGFRQGVIIVTLDVEKERARFFVQIVGVDANGDLWTPDAPLALVRAAASAITADAKDGNGRWLRLVVRVQSGSRVGTVIEVT